MKAIGFANKFYTLWDIRKDTTYFTDSYGKHWPYREVTFYTYIKNISFDLEKAKEAYPEACVIEELRGKCRDWSKKSEDLTPEILKFGKYCGKSISEVADIDFDYLLWLRGNSRGGLARLIEQLPEIQEYDQRKERERIEKEASHFRFKDGEYEITFEKNPSEINVSENPWLPEIDELLLKTSGNYLTFSRIDETLLYVIFPIGKRVQSLYPYNMVEINGKMTKTKNKTFKLNLKIELTLASEYGVTQFATVKNNN